MSQHLWFESLKQIIATCQTGLGYQNSPYDAERFELIKEKCYRLMEQYAGADFEKLEGVFWNEKAYVTPKVDVRAVVFRGKEVLLVREKIDGLWTMPGGWADIGYTPFEVAAKEAIEESGMVVKPIRLLAVMDKSRHAHPNSPFYIYKLFILCEEIGGNPTAGEETLDARFFPIDQLPPLSTERTTQDQILTMHDLANNPEKKVWCD